MTKTEKLARELYEQYYRTMTALGENRYGWYSSWATMARHSGHFADLWYCMADYVLRREARLKNAKR